MEVRDAKGSCKSEPVRSFIALTVDDFPKEKRPPCPACGATHIVSQGPDWTCQECGRRWKKVRRQCENCPYKTATIPVTIAPKGSSYEFEI